MEKTGQTVKIELDPNNRFTLQNQTVKNIIVDDQNYAIGTWRAYIVATYHIENGTWGAIGDL